MGKDAGAVGARAGPADARLASGQPQTHHVDESSSRVGVELGTAGRGRGVGARRILRHIIFVFVHVRHARTSAAASVENMAKTTTVWRSMVMVAW